jgi:hypothetical protein
MQALNAVDGYGAATSVTCPKKLHEKRGGGREAIGAAEKVSLGEDEGCLICPGASISSRATALQLSKNRSKAPTRIQDNGSFI